MTEKIWKNFEKDLKKLVNNIDNTVLKKLKSNFMETPSDYLKSEECDLIIKDTIEKISYNKPKIYIHLLDFKKSLKSATNVKRKCPIESAVDAKKRKLADEECIIDNMVVTVKDEEEEFLDYYNGCTTSATPIVEKLDEHQLKVDKYIAKLENVLQATKTQIEKLEEDELSLDDLDQENNSFIMLDKLKSHCVKVWRKICKLRNSKSRLHRSHFKTFTFKGTKYPDLNVIIEEFVKMKKFPDYNDIKVVVTTFVKEKSIKISNQRISELTVDIFTQLGNKLKKMRITEFVNYFGNHLTDQVKANENPILKDDGLKKVLVRNFALGQIKMDEVLDKYSKIEQGDKDDDSDSDISTEHSVNSDNEDVEENLENINLEVLQNESNLEVDEISSSNDDIPQENPDDVQPTITVTKEVSPHNNNATEHVDCPVSEEVTDNSRAIDLSLDNETTIPDTVESLSVTFAITDETLQSQKDTEQQIKEMGCHTFKFNIDQIKQGKDSVMYPATITINSSDENDSDSSEDILDLEENNFAYSSKLDDFCVAKSDIKTQNFTHNIIIPRMLSKCSAYPNYCNATIHVSEPDCHKVMSAYYGAKYYGKIIYSCPQCAACYTGTYDDFFNSHRIHLNQFQELPKKLISRQVPISLGSASTQVMNPIMPKFELVFPHNGVFANFSMGLLKEMNPLVNHTDPNDSSELGLIDQTVGTRTV